MRNLLPHRDQFFELTLEEEGEDLVWSSYKKTYARYGITQEMIFCALDVIENPLMDLTELSKEEAKKLYLLIWKEIGGDNMFPGLNYFLFDTSLLFGVPTTMNWVTICTENGLAKQPEILLSGVEMYRRRRGRSDPHWSGFGAAWTNRCNRVKRRALEVIRKTQEDEKVMKKVKTSVASFLCCALLSLAAAPRSEAQVGCNLEVSGGGILANTAINAGPTLDISSSGAVVGLGAGCDLNIDKTLVGVFARYSWMNGEGHAFGADVSYSRLWEVAARVGYNINPHVLPYLLAGWSGTNVDISAAGIDKGTNGLLLGAGLDISLDRGWFVRTEYTYHNFSSFNLFGATVEPDVHIVRLGIGWKFGGIDDKGSFKANN